MKFNRHGGDCPVQPLSPTDAICKLVARIGGTTQLLRIMKLTAILLTICCLQVSAYTSAQQVTYTAKNAPLDEVFTAIRKQTGYSFFYAVEDLYDARPVSISVKNMPVEDVMKKVLENQPLEYSVVNKTVFVIRKKRTAIDIQQSPEDKRIDVKGRVNNESGEPVPGATITIKGTTIATATDEKGEFILEDVEETATLIVSAVNIVTYEIRLKGKSNLTVNVQTKIATSEAVIITVNTGYQKISKERFVGSYATLDSLAYHRRAGMNIIDRLDGTVPGLVFNKKGGSAPIQIRGISTLNTRSGSMDPLIVVDNFPFYGDISSINPIDIESITVLKDAAAASIWGTRGGNGVIVISTKKAKFNQPFSVSATSNFTVTQKPDQYYLPQGNVSSFIDAEKFLFNNGFYDDNLTNTVDRPVVSPVVEILAKQRDGLLTEAEANNQINQLQQIDLRDQTNKYIYRNALSQQHYLNLSGSNNLVSYALSIGYNNTQSNTRQNKPDDQYTINSVNTIRPYKNLEIEIGVNLSKTTNRAIGFGDLLLSYPSTMYPYAQLADAQGTPLPIPNTFRKSYTDTAGGGKLLNWDYRPLDELNKIDNVSNNYFARINIAASYRLTDWLKAEVRFQNLQQNNDRKTYYSHDSYYARNLVNLYTQIIGNNVIHPIPVGGISQMANNKTSSNQTRAQLSFNKSWSTKHELTAMVAGEISETRGSSTASNAYGYDENNLTYITDLDYSTYFPIYGDLLGSSKIPIVKPIGEISNNRFVSLLANASYLYNGKYNFYASARRDGANVFGVKTNNKWKPLWSVGASWDIAKETFLSANWVSQLRLRASYGYMGNVDNTRSGFPALQLGQVSSLTNLPYAVPGDAPNPNLRWEEVQLTNLGIDFGFLKNRISGSVEVFEKKSKDLITGAPMDPTSGITYYFLNSANLRGRGFDLDIRTVNINKQIRWESRIALSYNKTIVTKFYNTSSFKATSFLSYGINPVEGQMAWGISSFRLAGLDPQTGDPLGYFNKQTSKDYVSILSDSVQNQVFHGSALPLYTGFFTNTVSWKGFSLSANITYRLAYYYRKSTINYTELARNWISHKDYDSRWQKPGDEAITTIPSFTYPLDGNRDKFYAYSTANVKRGDNIRLQDIRLDYTLGRKAGNKRFPFRSVLVYLYANNLNVILWRADHSSIDPDYQNYIIPPSRTLTAGVNISL